MPIYVHCAREGRTLRVIIGTELFGIFKYKKRSNKYRIEHKV